MHHNGTKRAAALKSGRNRRSALCLLVLLVFSLSRCSSFRSSEFPLTTLSTAAAGLEPLKDAFNGDAGKVRLMLLLDPT